MIYYNSIIKYNLLFYNCNLTQINWSQYMSVLSIGNLKKFIRKYKHLSLFLLIHSSLLFIPFLSIYWLQRERVDIIYHLPQDTYSFYVVGVLVIIFLYFYSSTIFYMVFKDYLLIRAIDKGDALKL